MKTALIIIDGPNGCGKSLITSRLDKCHKIFAPGYTKFGSTIRSLCRTGDELSPVNNDTIAHCMIADRLETFHNIIMCPKYQNRIFVTDRWFISTIAYQAITKNSIDTKIFNSILSSICDDEIDCLYPTLYHISCDEKLITNRIIQERKNNPCHGFDNFLSLEYEKQLILSQRFELAFNEFAKSFNSQNDKKITVKKLINNTQDDLQNCINEIQKTIDSLIAT